MTNTPDRIRSLIAEHLGCDVDKVTPDADLHDLGADSLDTTEIVMLMEKEFGIRIDEFDADESRTVGDIVELVDKEIAG